MDLSFSSSFLFSLYLAVCKLADFVAAAAASVVDVVFY